MKNDPFRQFATFFFLQSWSTFILGFHTNEHTLIHHIGFVYAWHMQPVFQFITIAMHGIDCAGTEQRQSRVLQQISARQHQRILNFLINSIIKEQRFPGIIQHITGEFYAIIHLNRQFMLHSSGVKIKAGVQSLMSGHRTEFI